MGELTQGPVTDGLMTSWYYFVLFLLAISVVAGLVEVRLWTLDNLIFSQLVES